MMSKSTGIQNTLIYSYEKKNLQFCKKKMQQLSHIEVPTNDRITYIKKNIRTSIDNKNSDVMILNVTELQLVSYLEETRKTKSILTNLMNTIIALIYEKVSYVECGSLIKSYSLIKNWREQPTNNAPIIKCCKIIQCSKTDNQVNEIYKKYSTMQTSNKKTTKECIDICKKYKRTEDREKVLMALANFICLFNDKNMDCMYWLIKMHNYAEEGITGATRDRQDSCIWIIWDFLEDYCNKLGKNNRQEIKKLLEITKSEYKKIKTARYMFLIKMILIILNSEGIDLTYPYQKYLNSDKEKFYLKRDITKKYI